MAHHATATAAPPQPGKTKTRAKGGKPAGHWVTVREAGGPRHLFLRGQAGHETATDRAANARTLRGHGHAPGGGSTAPAKPKLSLREQAAAHVKAKANAEAALKAAAAKPRTLRELAAERRTTAKVTPATVSKPPIKAGPHPAEALYHRRHKAAPYEPDLPLSVQRDHFADSEERRVAVMTGGKWNAGNEESDVDLPKPGGKGKGLHRIEVKSKSYGAKQELSVHHGAIEHKINAAHANPKDTWHSVLLDTRHSSEGGEHKGSYSGNEGYYKRAVGRYPIKQMHPFKNADELKRLIDTPNHKLPEKARGAFPTPAEMTEFRDKAAKERTYNNARSTARKQRLAAEGKSAYRGREKPTDQ